MMDRDEALDRYLKRLRQEAALSVPQVCERTKIQGRYVQALEDGRFGELPSNTHLRAFSLAIAQACGGDGERAALLVRRVLSPTGLAEGDSAPAQVSAAATSVTPSPAPKAPTPIAPHRRPASPPPVAAAVAVPRQQPVEEAGVAVAEAAEGLMQSASQRLKALPWQALIGLAAAAIVLSASLLWAVQRWQGRTAQAAPEATVENGAAVVEAKGGVASAVPVSAAAEVAPAPAATQLVLRARRPCWFVLQIDGQRLPTVTMAEGEKRSWPVTQKAVLLAGNVGALRVWWRGDNLGYLGELSARQNGLVFETGKAFRVDHSADLPLPAGVPE